MQSKDKSLRRRTLLSCGHKKVQQQKGQRRAIAGFADGEEESRTKEHGDLGKLRTASKKTGTSLLQARGAEFCQQSELAETGSPARASRKEYGLPTY